MNTAMPTASSPVAKAMSCVRMVLHPSSRPMHAPKPAPALAPNKSGETSGLRNMPWNDAPAAESAAPTITTSRMRGMRMLKMTLSRLRSSPASVCPWKWRTMPSTSSAGDTEYFPNAKLTSTMPTRPAGRAILTQIGTFSSYASAASSANAAAAASSNAEPADVPAGSGVPADRATTVGSTDALLIGHAPTRWPDSSSRR